MGHCTTSEPYVTKNYLYKTSWELLYNGDPMNSHINTEFFGHAGNWANYLNFNWYEWSSGKSLDWIDTIGIGRGCTGGSSYHKSAEAIDLKRLRFYNGSAVHIVDMLTDWESSTLSRRRRYLAVAALTRMYMRNTLHGWYDDKPAWSSTTHTTGLRAHHNHIHLDNVGGIAAVPAIRKTAISDTTLIQAACNNLNGATLVIDGDWGPATNAAYLALRSKFNMNCYDPLTSSNNARLFLAYIARHGIRNHTAGTYKAAC